MKRIVILPLLALAAIAATRPAHADEPAAPPPAWTGSLGAGLSWTGGNTDTRSYNVSFAVMHDPKGDNVFKADGLYLRGEKDGDPTVDKKTFGLRDEYRLAGNFSAFGEVRWRADRFANLTYGVTPLAGVVYKVVATPDFELGFDAGVGGIWEKFESIDERQSSFVWHVGQSLRWKISPSASLTEAATGLWKSKDTSDALYHFELGLATSVTTNSELKLAFAEDYRNRPPLPTLKKSDQSLVATFLLKF